MPRAVYTHTFKGGDEETKAQRSKHAHSVTYYSLTEGAKTSYIQPLNFHMHQNPLHLVVSQSWVRRERKRELEREGERKKVRRRTRWNELSNPMYSYPQQLIHDDYANMRPQQEYITDT